MTREGQLQCLNILDYLSDLFTCSGNEQFTRTQVLVILNLVKHDPELFDPLLVVEQEEAVGRLLWSEDE